MLSNGIFVSEKMPLLIFSLESVNHISYLNPFQISRLKRYLDVVAVTRVFIEKAIRGYLPTPISPQNLAIQDSFHIFLSEIIF
jgi:hypothetical protein